MGREVRKVPKDWNHPKKENSDRYQPMFDEDFESACIEWDQGYEKWKLEPKQENCTYWEWAGGPPDREYYRPKWTGEEMTHFMMYETTSEGTPISPAFETPEELAKWLVDNNASAFADMTATYEQWLQVCRGRSAPSAVYSPETGMISGVAGL
jgi:hypothetical protein